MKLSAVILARNEEENIADCINSVSFADEILVIDDNSTDNTGSYAKSAGANVFKRSLKKNYASQKNFALSKAKGEWILFIDADERISRGLQDEIIESIGSDEIDAYEFRRIDKFLGKWLKYGDIGAYRDIRLMKRNVGKWNRVVHEYFVTSGNVGQLNNPLHHYSHPTVGKLVESTNRWSGWHAEANKKEGKTSSIVRVLFWPGFKFLDTFLIKKGFLDGVRGFVFAIFVSFHSYLAWSKLWVSQKEK